MQVSARPMITPAYRSASLNSIDTARVWRRRVRRELPGGPDAGTGRVFAAATGANGFKLDSDGFGFDGSGQVARTGGYQRIVVVVPFGGTPNMRVDDGPLLTATPILPVRPGSQRIKVFLGPKADRAPCEVWIDRVLVR